MRASAAFAILTGWSASSVYAGSVCLTHGFMALGGDTTGSTHIDVFPIQGNPCESDADNVHNSNHATSLCDRLGSGIDVTVCGEQVTLIRDDGGEPFLIDDGLYSECGVRMSIDGVEYDGRVIPTSINGDDVFICSQSCQYEGLTYIHTQGSVLFENMPICAPAPPSDW